MLKNMTEVPAATYEVHIAGAARIQPTHTLHESMIDKGYAEVGRAPTGRMLGCLMSDGKTYVDQSLIVD